jgi:tetratricopeptide (TPR) repeat protein
MMSKRTQGNTKAKKTSTSGAKGGPSTSRGMNYQITLAVYHALVNISRSLYAFNKDRYLQIEPRVLASGEITSFDLGFYPDDLWVEAKLEPTRDDIVEWLRHVVVGEDTSSSRKFQLVFHKGAGPHLNQIRKLIRLAKEANGDAAVFNGLCTAEGVSADDKFLDILGQEGYRLLGRMQLEQVPEYILESDVELKARLIAGDAGGLRLREYLFTKFHGAAPNRTTLSIKELIIEARERGVQFQQPSEIDTRELSALCRSALIVMQACSAGIPTQVISSALGSSESDVTLGLEELRVANIVSLDDGSWALKPMEWKVSSTDAPITLSRALSSLVTFIRTSEGSTRLGKHVRNVISLAQECMLSDPKLVAGVFTDLDKQLKRLGNKRLVWLVADLSRQASRSIRNRENDIVECEARSLICGTSWALQRLHKLEKARVDAHEALKLAEYIGSGRTMAFCLKCLGRLCRMEAEAMANGEEKRLKLQESIRLLEEAIEKFAQLDDVGPTDPEVGDCHSLLGRTYLELKDLNSSRAAIVKAYDLITDETSKDYIDLVILNGDFEVANGDRRSAGDQYDRALQISKSTDPEISEMRARAFLQKGSNEEAQGKRESAISAYQGAAKIWTSLQDEEFAARATWKRMRLSEGLSNNSLKRLEAEPTRVRVEAVNVYNERVQETGKATLARRKEPSATYWEQLIKEAKQRLAKQVDGSDTKW